MTRKYSGLTALTAALVLSACGGGGGDSGSGNTGVGNTLPAVHAPTLPVAVPTQPTVTASAEGVYEGSLSGGLSHVSLVTDSNRLYSMIGATTGGVFGISRFLEGVGASNNGSFTATDVREYGVTPSTVVGTFAGTYVPAASLTGILTMGSTSTALTGTALANMNYVYNTAAKLANITGAWTLRDLSGATVALTVAADGTFTGNAGACAMKGSLTPHASGKNLFIFALVAGAAPCPRPDEVTTGVAIEFKVDVMRQLIAAGSNVTRVNGTAWVGAR
ncbi:hypothetical protein [Massilia sp. S19_KUP03_FR1]|uniref:hypothetical protein n=1 Tax=Massilia sp. S19_KUP03_FR1 TaxID=3025503 RepID=UPI002FCCEC04